MPIPGLTDRQPSFKEIGRLRKGAPKDSGQMKDLTYFRPDFRLNLSQYEQEAVDRFFAFYGKEPTRVNVRLAFPETIRCWDANYEVYNTAGMLGMAGGVEGKPGLWWKYLRNHKTGEIIVDRDGNPPTPFDPAIPIYSYKNRKGEDTAVYAKPVGRLKVMIPEMGIANYVSILTHSVYDISNLSSELAAIDEMAHRVGLNLAMVPFVLSRRWDTVSISFNGHKQMKNLNLMHIDIDPRWASAQFTALNDILPGMTLPAPAKMLELPAFVNEPPAEEYYDEKQEPEGEPEPAGMTLTLENALATRTAKGTLFSNLSDEQLQMVAISATDEQKIVAAKVILQARGVITAEQPA